LNLYYDFEKPCREQTLQGFFCFWPQLQKKMKGTNMKNYKCNEKGKQNEPDFILNAKEP